MTFKKLTIEEIKYSNYENLIGMPFKGSDSNSGINSISRLNSYRINSNDKAFDNENFEETKFNSKGNKIPINIEIFNKILIENNSVKEYNNEKWINLRNISNKDTIWNIQIDFESNEYHYKIPKLSPSESWRDRIYIDTEEEEKSGLEILEKISKNRYIIEKNEESNFYLDPFIQNTLFFTVFIENTLNYPIKNILLMKDLPDSIIKVEDFKSELGSSEISKKKIMVKIPSLKPGMKSIIKFKLIVEPKISQTGIIKVEYNSINRYENLYKISNLSGSIKAGQFLYIDERDESPGIWDCAVGIINQSDYIINLKDSQLFLNTDNGPKLLNELKTVLELQSFEEKTLLNSVIEQESQPNLIKKLKISPTYNVKINNSYSLEIKDNTLEVISLATNKTFSVSEVDSFIKTDFKVNIALENKSTSPINHVFIIEEIPNHFSVLKTSGVELLYDDKGYRLNEDGDVTDEYNNKERLSNLRNEIEKLQGKSKDYVQKINDSKSKIETLENKLKKLSKISQTTELEKIEGAIKDFVDMNSENENKQSQQIKLKDKILSEINKIESEINKLEIQEKLTQEKIILESKQAKLKESGELSKNKVKELEKDIKKISTVIEEIKVKLEIAPENEKDSFKKQLKNDEKELNQLNKQITSEKDNEKEFRKQFSNIKKEIKEIEKKIDNNIDLDKLSDIIKQNNENLVNKKSSLKEIEDKISEIQNDIKSLEIQIQKNMNELNSIKKSIEENVSIHNTIKELNEIIKNLEQEKIKISEKLESLENDRDLIEIIADDNLDSQKKLKFLEKIFKDNLKNNGKTGIFNSYIIKDFQEKSYFVIFINNLKNILSSIQNNKKLLINYPMSALNPRNNEKYNFPSKILYDYDPIISTQETEISENNLPTIQIIHKRKKLLLGKVVESFSDKNKFAITLIVSNKADIPISDLNIIDTLPNSAKISNAYYDYKEEKIDKFLKEVLWTIEKIPPFQELQISYVVELENLEFDLNSVELRTK